MPSQSRLLFYEWNAKGVIDTDLREAEQLLKRSFLWARIMTIYLRPKKVSHETMSSTRIRGINIFLGISMDYMQMDVLQ